eukprot:4576648-Alexandrium_andersonii.AAC.1
MIAVASGVAVGGTVSAGAALPEPVAEPRGSGTARLVPAEGAKPSTPCDWTARWSVPESGPHLRTSPGQA